MLFSTTYQKAFYQHLKNHPRISITALKRSETLDSVGFTLNGVAEETDSKYLDQIFSRHPEMEQISANYSERTESYVYLQ